MAAQRDAFHAAQSALPVERLVFIDESGFRLGTPPHYGWSPIGQKTYGKVAQGAWRTMTMIGALALDGFRGLMTVDAATDGDVFLAFVEQVLVPQLRPGDIVVMDNLGAHRGVAVQQLVLAAGAEVLFLPPYSPDYNPIEKAWSKIKTVLRRLTNLTREAFDDAVAAAMETVTLPDIRAWTAYSGYNIDST